MKLPAVVLLPFVLLSGAAGHASAASPPDCHVRGQWLVCETEHFSVWSRLTKEVTVRTAESCERARTKLRDVWCDAGGPAWRSKCVVTLHADPSAYAAAIGRPGDRSVGCTTLQTDGDEVTFRRVDLRCDAGNWRESALAHELTHVVLADRCGGRPLPLWADEGLAVLSEPDETRRRREAAYREACRRGSVDSVRELLDRRDPPPAARRDGFYGRSGLLVAFLIERGTPSEFLRFLELAERAGYDAALRECYGLGGVAGLDTLRYENETAAAPGFLLEVTGRAALAVRIQGDAVPVTLRDPVP